MLRLLQELGPALNLRPAADETTIKQVQEQLGWSFPDEYVAFLRASNGCDGDLAHGDYIYLWSIEDLVEANSDYGFLASCPEIVAFGTNGGGEAFGFTRADGRVVIVPLLGPEMVDAIDVGQRFTDFLRRSRPADWS